MTDDFVKQMGIKLVAHSPLKRARQTAEGMLGCVTERTDVDVDTDSSAKGKKADSVARVVEMPFLSERTPLEVRVVFGGTISLQLSLNHSSVFTFSFCLLWFLWPSVVASCQP